ncbi:MAG: hypothetical protein JOZ54_11635 [Acidobacteria bacterium]|nr:hypothetical protein [Acidobacteriota bacterium]
MRKFKGFLLGAVLVVGTASMQAQTRWGGRVSFYPDGSFTTVGLEAVVPLRPGLAINPNFEISNTKDDTLIDFPNDDLDLHLKSRFWTGNLDLTYDLFSNDRSQFWIGAGAAYSRAHVEIEGIAGSAETNDSRWGGNLLAGYAFGSGRVKPYVQAKETFLSGSNTFSAGLGVRF